ncbi:MAG: peptidylprolyl isomerase, partial [Candidatus Zixiibacteriota bacterium]
RSWAIIGLVLITALGCGPAFISRKNLHRCNFVVVEADTLFELSMPQLFDMLAASKVLPDGGVLSREAVRDFVDSVLVDTLIGLRAREIDLTQYYNQHRIYRQRYHRYMINRFLDEVVYKQVAVDSEEVVQFYHNRPDLFAIEEQVLVHQILISPLGLKHGSDSLYYRGLTPEELGPEAEHYVHQVRRLLDFGEPFADVARAYSHDSYSVDSDGLVGWTKRNTYLDPFDSIAFSMKPGEVSQPYLDLSGWHILYIEDHKPEGIPPLDSAQYAIAEASLIQHKANRLAAPLRDSILGKIELTFNEDLLDTNVYKVDKTVWAAVVNGQDTIDFNEMRTLEEPFRQQYQVDNTTVDMKKQMLRELASVYAFVQAARAAGIDTLPEVIAEKEALRHKYARSIAASGSSGRTWVPPDSLVEQYFHEHEDEFRVGRPFAVQQIIVEDSLTGEFVRDQALAGVDFLDLAEEFYPGEPSIRRDLANLGEISPGDVPEPLFEAARSTPVGGISHPVKTEYGYHVVKVLSRADTVGVNEARHAIMAILVKEHQKQVFRQFRDSLYARFNVRFRGAFFPVHLPPLAERQQR